MGHRRLVRHVGIAVTVMGLIGLYLSPWAAFGFTQSGAGTFINNTIPMGHEWITRMAAHELLGVDPIAGEDPEDPRDKWTKEWEDGKHKGKVMGKAKNTKLDDAQAEVNRIKALPYDDVRYRSVYKPIYDAIIGERWVDIGGINVATAKFTLFNLNYNCFNAVTQEATEVQYDHFMRQYDDREAQGGIDAAERSRERFIKYFVQAAMASKTTMQVWDGGAKSSLTEVDRNYFLFGRAVHMFQDSFSPEHTVRMDDDKYERVRQVKSYMCAAGSEQHTHSAVKEAILTYKSGDVIWKRGEGWIPGSEWNPRWSSYKPSNMKVLASGGNRGVQGSLGRLHPHYGHLDGEARGHGEKRGGDPCGQLAQH